MKLFRQLIFLAFLFFITTQSFGQRFSLYNSQTFPDVIENPTRPYFYDTCKSWATNLVVPQIGYDFAVLGDANKLIIGAFFSDTLRSSTIPNGKRKGNIIYSSVNLNLFSLKILLNPKRQTEFLLNFGVRAESRINVKNDLLNLALFGNGDYAGQRLEGAFNMKSFIRAYTELNFGYRTDINNRLSLGGSIKYINGIADLSMNIEESYFETEEKGRYIRMGLIGTLNSSTNPSSKTAGDDVLRNFINNKNIGFGISLGTNYKFTESLNLTTNIKDIGGINWNNESVGYSLGKEVEYRGANAFAGREVRDSVYRDIKQFAIDSLEGRYFTNLNTRLDLNLQKSFGDRLSGSFIFSKPFFYPEADFAVLSDLRLTRKWHLLSNLVYNTSNYFALGAHLQFKGRWFEYYFGSEQLGNMVFHSQGLSRGIANQVVPIGFDYHVGLAFKFGRCRNKPVNNQILKDSDGDGVVDGLDKCPSTPGSIDRAGCPYQDTDGDGIIDFIDDCEKTAGVVEFGGCPIPDMDRDGVLDGIDDCPNVAGPKGNKGCPEEPKKADLTPEEQKIIDEAFETLVFKTGETTIDKYYIPNFIRFSNVLKKRPEIKVIIEGYTDNEGSSEENRRLSQRRADAVKQFFVDKGINTERLTAIGYGEENPIADNANAFGRSLNRRVEFKLIQ